MLCHTVLTNLTNTSLATLTNRVTRPRLQRIIVKWCFWDKHWTPNNYLDNARKRLFVKTFVPLWRYWHWTSNTTIIQQQYNISSVCFIPKHKYFSPIAVVELEIFTELCLPRYLSQDGSDMRILTRLAWQMTLGDWSAVTTPLLARPQPDTCEQL